MSARETTVYIVRGTPLLSNSYEHSLYFPNKTAQESYFAGKVVKTFSAYTYHRKQWNVKVQASIESAQNWTYVYFRNFDGKTYYYFITDVTYINENTVELALELDVLQTYMFDWDLLECFIERTHVQDDRVGENTIDEGLDIGEYEVSTVTNVEELTDLCILVLLTTEDNGTVGYSKMYGNVFSGLRLVAVLPEDKNKFASWLCSETASSGLNALAVVNMWMYPKNLVRVSGGWVTTTGHGMHEVVDTQPVEVTVQTMHDWDNNESYGLHSYHVRNNKLYCFPYNFLYVTNNAGGNGVFRYEWFKDKTAESQTFVCYGGLSPECGVALTPQDYRGIRDQRNFDEALSSGAYPTCAWDADGYKIFLATNRNQLQAAEQNANLSYGVGMVTGIAGSISADPLSTIARMATTAVNSSVQHHNTINSLMAQRKDAKISPDQAKGCFGGSLNVAHGRQTFTVHHKHIRLEHLKTLDEYFSRYGYKVNRIDRPRIHNRKCFTYVKTVGCLVGGEFPVGDRNAVARVFDSGVTFWDPTTCVPGLFHVDNEPVF